MHPPLSTHRISCCCDLRLVWGARLSICLFVCLLAYLSALLKRKRKRRKSLGGVEWIVCFSVLVWFALLCFSLISSGVCGWTLWAGG
ncbi:hypothetical protein V8E51_008863 [Hyaloscypha variabilis]